MGGAVSWLSVEFLDLAMLVTPKRRRKLVAPYEEADVDLTQALGSRAKSTGSEAADTPQVRSTRVQVKRGTMLSMPSVSGGWEEGSG